MTDYDESIVPVLIRGQVHALDDEGHYGHVVVHCRIPDSPTRFSAEALPIEEFPWLLRPWRQNVRGRDRTRGKDGSLPHFPLDWPDRGYDS